MRMLLNVLMRAVAAFLKSCAEFLLRRAEPVPAAPAMEAVRLPGPPEDWTRRANPPPPAHWVDLVRRRAPRFLASLPEAARAISAGDTPAMDGSRIHRRPAASVPSGPLPAPVRAGDRKDGAAAAALRRSATPRPVLSPRRLRVVTSLQESARVARTTEPAGDSAEALEETTVASVSPSLPFPTLPTPVQAPAPFAARQVEPDSDAKVLRSRVDLPLEVEARTPGIPEVETLFAETRSSGSPDVPFPPVQRPRPLAARSVLLPPPRFRVDGPLEALQPQDRAETVESSAARLPAWPELPSRSESDVIDECLALVREQRRLDARDAEQRGNPWNA